MQENNPYAAPQAVQTPPVANYPQAPQIQVGIWRQGKILIMHKQAQLPDLCIKSNQPAEGKRLMRKLSWHHPAISISILAGVLIYVVLAAILTKKATIHIGLSKKYFIKRRRAIIIGWCSALAGIAMLFVGIGMIEVNETAGTILMIMSPFILLFGIFYGLLASRIITATKIDKHYVWIKGAHPEFLDQFQEA